MRQEDRLEKDRLPNAFEFHEYDAHSLTKRNYPTRSGAKRNPITKKRNVIFAK